MASKGQLRELSNVPEVQLRQKLHSFIANTACRVYGDLNDLTSPVEDSTIQEQLLVPLQWLLCGQDPAITFASMENHQGPSHYCGKVFKSGEPSYFCKDCQTDPTCCLCMECFERSEHKNHHYKLFASGGGGCCDCGDPEAWKSCVSCELHKPKEGDNNDVDPLSTLSSDHTSRASVFFRTLLLYCMDLLCWQEGDILPPMLMEGHVGEMDKHAVYLYNDEEHSYEEVIHTLTRNVRLSQSDAVKVATFVDRKGRGMLKVGTSTECTALKRIVNVGLPEEKKPLRVEALPHLIAANQNCAVHCLNLLRELSEKSVAFRRLIAMCLTEPSSNGSILDRIFIKDGELWISARLGWQRLVMSSIFMDQVWKKHLAISLAKNYNQLQKNFMSDSHDHDVCISNITVQILTVPSLSWMLIAEHDLLKTMVTTVLEILEPFKDPASGTLKLSSPKYNQARMNYVLNDLRYVLRSKPESWTPQLRQQVLVAFDLFLQLLSLLQNVEGVKRELVRHVESEEPWENVFNFCVVLQPAVVMLVDWCKSDGHLLQESVSRTVKKFRSFADRELVAKRLETDASLTGCPSMELIPFDVMKSPISLHQPLQRLLAALLLGASSWNVSLKNLLGTTDPKTCLQLMEHSVRTVVLAVQVLAGMWKRNGFGMVNQILNYQHHVCRDIMYDKDIVLIQAMASLMEPDQFLYALIYKFRLNKWLTRPNEEASVSSRGEPKEDAVKYFLCEAEEFLFLLITIFCERYTSGIGEGITEADSLRREVLHRLYLAPTTHSELIKQLRRSHNESDIDEQLKTIAKHSLGTGSKYMFELKPGFEEEYSPFFYHYSKSDHSKAEESHRRKLKADPAKAFSRPRQFPQFTSPFSGITRLCSSSVMHRVFQCVFKHASSKFSSDRLLHESLYLCAHMLFNEEAPSARNSLCCAAIGRYGGNGFLDSLNVLLNDKKVEEHRPLITWMVQYLTKVRDQGIGMPATNSVSAATSITMEFSKNEMKLKREKVMQQMADMQKKFLETYKEELDQIDLGSVEEEKVHASTQHTALQCALGVAPLLSHTLTPMAATCILCQEETRNVAGHEKVFVQAAQVQRSSVLRRCVKSTTDRDNDLLLGRADSQFGVFTGGCGHYMHAECWTRFVENKKLEQNRRFLALYNHSVKWDLGEFFCPLCASFCNAVCPLLPLTRPKAEDLKAPSSQLMFPEWRELVVLAQRQAESAVEVGSSVDITFLDKLALLFPGYAKPAAFAQKRVEEGVKTDMVQLFSQAVYTRTYNTHFDENSPKVCVAQWNNVAYTIESLEFSARNCGKFIYEYLSTRQMDVVQSMIQCCSTVDNRPSLPELAVYVGRLMSTFLPEISPFAELPSILEMDCFVTLVNLHFSLLALFSSLISPTGCVEDNGVVLPLVAITDCILVRVGVAAQLLQYLLTSPPAMETSDNSASTLSQADSSSEVSIGRSLQGLWIKYRHQAGLSADCPPTPYDLYVGAQSHLYPLLHRCSLFFRGITGISLVHSSASAASTHQDLYAYLDLPASIHLLLEPSGGFHLQQLAENWCTHPRIRELVDGHPPALLLPRQLMELPQDYTVLVKQLSTYRCPKMVASDQTGDAQTPVLCLVCGETVCTRSYCCQVEVKVEGEEPIKIGGITNHAQSCGGGIGMALLVRDHLIIFVDATDLHNVRGCTFIPPYRDEYGEPDPGFSRGNPLKLQQESYHQICEMWYLHKIPEQIVKEQENNQRLMVLNWAGM